LVFGTGKACMGMVHALSELLGDRLTTGVAITKYDHSEGFDLGDRIQVYEANHPTPDDAGVTATLRMLKKAKAAGPETLVIVCMTGGSSALLVAPAEGISLGEKQAATKLLLGCGCSIDEKNGVLKHLSQVKGGQLLNACLPARVLSLIVSDVVGDPLDVIGSGPTVPDPSTFNDCVGTLRKYGIYDSFPSACISHLEAGAAGQLPDTLKPFDPAFEKAITCIVASNKMAVDACVAEAASMGFNTMALSSFIEGEATEVAKIYSGIAKELVAYESPVALPACVVGGGETTVTLPPNPGTGGRNQAMALSAAIEISGMQNVAILAGGTDGGDGPGNDSAGAVVTGSDVASGTAVQLDAQAHLQACDAYTYFNKLETEALLGNGNTLHLRDGPTGTNVADLTILLVDSPTVS